MNVALLQQSAAQLSRRTQRWDRRMRLATSLIWLPRGLISGVMAGIVVAILSRLRPWLLPEQTVVISALSVILAGIGMLVLVWGWPRSQTYRARFFDQTFDLKERVSTALELANGVIAAPDTIMEQQINDAVATAGQIDAAARLPLRLRWREVIALIVMAAILVYLLVSENPQTEKLFAERELENAIDNQIAQIGSTIQEIQADDTLTPDEQSALTRPLEEALSILEQPDVSQQEAMAALAEAADQLGEMTDGMSAEQEAAYQQAASELADSSMTSDLAEAFSEPDLNQAAGAMADMADELGQTELSAQQQADLAQQLEQAADQLEESNPALAEKFREAAQALRDGDLEAAQEALREVSDLIEQQQDELEDSSQAEAAQDAREQVEESQRELAQAGQESGQQQPEQSNQQQGDSQTQQQMGQEAAEQPLGQQQGQLEPGQGEQAEQGNLPQGDAQQTSESASSGSSQMAGESEPQMPSGQSASSEEAQSQAQVPDNGSGNAEASGMQSGEGQAIGSQSADAAGSGAGSQQGGAGVDDIIGAQSQGNTEQSANNNSTEGGGIQNYESEFAPSTIGGQGDDIIDVGGEPSSIDDGQTIQQGEFGPNPSGESTLSYTGVYNEYQDIVSDALESGRIPLDQRDVIHDYFSSLDQ